MTLPITTRLKAGDLAPDFEALDVYGNRVKLSEINDKHILVVFFRYSGCPWCNLAIHRLTLEYARLQKHGCSVVAFIQSEKSKIMSNIYDRHDPRPPFPIIADHQQVHYKKYGVSASKAAFMSSLAKIPEWLESSKKHGFKQTKIDGEFFMVPAAFLINGSDRTIAKAVYGKSFYDHEMFISIYDTIYFE